MQTLCLNRNSPNNFILVPNVHLSKDQPNADQVWKLNLNSRDPHPFCLSTTYGLQAKSMRLFPNFILENHRITKPEDFSLLPKVISYTPSSLQIEAEYQNSVAFLFTFFLPEPEVVIGKIQIENLRDVSIDITAQWAVNLVPMGKGQPSHPDKSGNNQFLTGKTNEIVPVLFMTGGPSAISNPFPALSIQLGIQPGTVQAVSWALVSKENKTTSLEKAKQIIFSSWQEALQEHTMHHAGQTINIKTGNQDWDAAFFLAQVQANTHLLKSGQQTSAFDFIKTRLPDQSFASTIQGTNTNHLTNLELNHLCQVMLPAEVDVIMHLLQTQIDDQVEKLRKHTEENGLTLNSTLKACPLLSSILLEIYEITQDISFLERNYLKLNRLFQSWVLDPSTGVENEHLHWDKPAQLQIDIGLFKFDIWENYSKGLDIKKAESPALYAMLFNEAKALFKLLKILGEKSQQRYYMQCQKDLQGRLINCWQDNDGVYGYQDIETHMSPSCELLYQGDVKGSIEIKKTFTKPQRLQCHIFAADEHTRSCIIKIRGKSVKGDVIEEVFRNPNILWVLGRAHLTTGQLFKELESLSFEGLDKSDEFLIETADYSQPDITCLLPLWADVGRKAHLQKTSSVIMNPEDPKFSFGIPETWESQSPLPDGLPLRVNVLWNTLILEGLLKQGEFEKASKFFANLMETIVHGLKDYNGFYPLFNVGNGGPVGQLNEIKGLVPIRLFLKIAGIKILSPSKVALWDFNPFPWPIEVHWKGLSLWKEQAQTKITFPNGATAENNSDKPILITSDS